MKTNVLKAGPVVDTSSSVATLEPEKETVNKAIVKKDVTKMATETKKAVAKAITEEKKEATKKEAAKKETVKKETVKKEAAKKAPAKKEAAKNGVTEVYVQFNNQELSTESIKAKVEAAYAAEGHKISATDDVKIYVKPEENMIYYVVNESYASGINLF